MYQQARSKGIKRRTRSQCLSAVSTIISVSVSGGTVSQKIREVSNYM
jgi:hypothetical protein